MMLLMTPSISCDTSPNDNAIGGTLWQWQHVVLTLMPMMPHDQKVMLHLISVILTCGIQWYH